MTQDTERGRLFIDVHDEGGQPITEPLHLYLRANVPQLGAQYHVTSKGGDDDISGEFPVGSYTLQLFAAGYDVAREAVHLTANHTTHLNLRLPKRAQFSKPTLEERLAVYGLKPDQLASIEVQKGQHVVLDYRKYEHPEPFTVLHPQSIHDLKRWLGAPDSAFGHNQPRFGALPPGELETLSAAAREYIYGNSRAVARYEAAINRQLQLRARLVLVPIFYFLDVTIYDGATLGIGNGSSVFFANTLTIYKTGTLRVSGPVRADIGILQQ